MRNLFLHIQKIWEMYYKKFLFASALLLIGSVIGYFYEESQSLIPIKNPGHNWLYYFTHNVKQAGLLIILGLFTYGILSLLFIFINGLVIGIGIETILHHQRVDLIWTSFLPHAIFELTAILWAWVVSFMLVKAVIQWIRGKRPPIEILKREVFPSILSIFILLLIAALIEGR